MQSRGQSCSFDCCFFLSAAADSLSFNRNYDTIKLYRVRFAPVALTTGSDPGGETRSTSSCNKQQITSQGDEFSRGEEGHRDI